MEPSAFLLALRPYLEAFAEHEPARRMALLVRALTPQAEIRGPRRVFAGYAQIAEKIDGFHENWPGCRLVMMGGVVCFGNAAHFAHAIVGKDGSSLAGEARGHSVAELAEDGRIHRVLAFWGPAPPLPASWPAELAAPAAQGGPGLSTE